MIMKKQGPFNKKLNSYEVKNSVNKLESLTSQDFYYRSELYIKCFFNNQVNFLLQILTLHSNTVIYFSAEYMCIVQWLPLYRVSH